MKKILFIFCIIFTSVCAQAQVRIKMQHEDGVFYLYGKANGVPMKFIFDTGASNVSLSLTEAMFMLKNGQLKAENFKGTIYTKVANGEITEGQKIILDEIDIAGIKINNIEAVISESLTAPILLGQSAIQKLGPISLDGNILTISNAEDGFSDEEAKKLYWKGYQAYEAGNYDETIASCYKGLAKTENKQIRVALYGDLALALAATGRYEEGISIAYEGLELDVTNYTLAYNLSTMYYDSKQYRMAAKTLTKILDDEKLQLFTIKDHSHIYSYLGLSLYELEEYASAKMYLNLCLQNADLTDSRHQANLNTLAEIYYLEKDYSKALELFGLATQTRKNFQNISRYAKMGKCCVHLVKMTDALDFFEKGVGIGNHYYQEIMQLKNTGTEEYVSLAEKIIDDIVFCVKQCLIIYSYYDNDAGIPKCINALEGIDENYITHLSEIETKAIVKYYLRTNKNAELKQLLDSTPHVDNPEFLFTKAMLMNDGSNEAIGIYRKILVQEKTYEPSYFSYATVYNNLAWNLHCLGQDKEALAYAEHAIELDNTDDNNWETLGEVYFGLEDYISCVSAMDKCLKLNEKNRLALKIRGQAKIKLGKTKDGEKDVKRSNALLGM